MSDRLLSQEEINALLQQNSLPEKPSGVLTADEKDALGEIGNIAMGTAATTLSTLINHKVRITTPKVSLTSMEQLSRDFPVPHVSVEVEFNEGIEGGNLLILRQQDASIIANAMLGDAYSSEELLDEMKLSALSEAMNQMMGSAATSISTMFKNVVSITPPAVEMIDFSQDAPPEILFPGEMNLVRVNFNLSIEDLLESEIMQLIPLAFAKEMVAFLLGGGEPPAPEEYVEAPEVNEEERRPTVKRAMSPAAETQEQPIVQPVQFAPLRPLQEPQGDKGNIGLLMDIPLDVSVELGRTERLIKEVLELGVGSLLELDKLAGEPVDIRVNGKLIAKGEVVVVGENFGVRVTEIIGVKERVDTLQ